LGAGYHSSYNGVRAYSSNLVDWAVQEVRGSELYACAAANGEFIAASSSHIYYSSDGVSWKYRQVVKPPTSAPFRGAKIAAGRASVVGAGHCFYSANLVEWADIPLPPGRSECSLEFADKLLALPSSPVLAGFCQARHRLRPVPSPGGPGESEGSLLAYNFTSNHVL